MESELKDLNPKPISQQQQQQQQQTLPEPIDDRSTKDDYPLLLKPAVNIEELEKKFAAYVRNDVYGTMGRGELPWAEKFLLGIALLTLVPIRVVVSLTILVVYYLICRVCTLFSAPNREEEDQEDYAHMGGWRRAVIVRSGRFLARVMLFVLGFYWINETYRNLDISETECNDLSEEPKRPGAIISNHISYLDILYHMSSFFPSFVAKVRQLVSLRNLL
ncbi:hypothetical protein TEA_005591 [Camellia sinensis var. sinensis]|uniref:Phospholipid/glycerol acyltransferase domain-containing protein n=1 Tax=Camellia sinensis var. sinensis TaxID=542762 RepID=A0A4S4EJF0_CAMSN|nr:hypothetical protein TEA_005591 [Camellia sinensis var. sinensis]